MKMKNNNTWKPVGDKFAGAKISKTFRIDAEIFLWLRREAERTGIPYQTLLNAKLREAMNLPDYVKKLVDQRVEEILSKKAA
ncbi:MAG: hypothetical protein A2583_04685 [Bdellovibrionales bacterium RIFOXYD1_FULL_53_11]|nr:MAG: hypothetical protein A2583_04685 [Bdellovibrionales bacterium RIFOXYD1_FULL_53_11]